MKNLCLSLAIIVPVFLLAILPGCAGQPATPQPTMPPPESEADTPPTSGVEPSSPGEDWVWSEAAGEYIRKEDGTFLWGGFHHEWKNSSRKFRDLMSYFDKTRYHFDPETGTSKLTGNMIGQQTLGSGSDKLNFYTIKGGIKTGVAEFRHGTADFLLVSGDVGEHVEMVFPQHIDTDGLEKYDNLTVFMRGFSFAENACQCPASLFEGGAYPIQCFGLWVTDIEGPYDKGYEPGQYLRLNMHVMLHFSSAPSLLRPKPDPWRYKVTYYYTLVGGNNDEFSFTNGDKFYSGISMGSNYSDCPRVPDAERQITIQGDTGYNMGISVFRGFFIKTNHDTSDIDEKLRYQGNVKNLGRLVRTIDVAVNWQEYSSKTGTASFSPDIYFCNKSAITYAMNTEYGGFLTLLQFQDPDQLEYNLGFKDAGDGEIEGTRSSPYGWTRSLEPFSFPTP